MPSKSKRAAKRQANTRQKRQRGNAAPQVFDVGPTKRKLEDEDEEQTTSRRPGVAAAARTAPAVPTRPTRASRLADASAGASPAYPYLGSEIKRIGIIAGVIFATLLVLTFVMDS